MDKSFLVLFFKKGLLALNGPWTIAWRRLVADRGAVVAACVLLVILVAMRAVRRSVCARGGGQRSVSAEP